MTRQCARAEMEGMTLPRRPGTMAGDREVNKRRLASTELSQATETQMALTVPRKYISFLGLPKEVP